MHTTDLYYKFQVSAALCMRSAFFWDVTQRTVTSKKSEYLKNKVIPLQTIAIGG